MWFDKQAEPAAEFYVSVFHNSRIKAISHYGEAGFEFHHKPPGSVMTVSFELDGQPFTALNGGPLFQLSEAFSLQVYCDTQAEVDYYWDKLGEGGDDTAQQCGWLKDKFGLSWQIVPTVLDRLMCDEDATKSNRTMAAVLEMKKIDIATLEQAHAGK